MKKLISSLLLTAGIFGTTSCRSDYDPMADGNYRLQREKEKPMVKTIRMHFGGDVITETEEPLFRAEGDGDAYAAVNVWRYEKGAENPEKEWYAYGLFKSSDEAGKEFDITEDIKLDVVTGYTYCFEATILIEREDKVWYNSSMVKAFQEPFMLADANSENFGPATGYSVNNLKNEFIYTWNLSSNEHRYYFCDLESGTASVDTSVGSTNDRYAAFTYPRVKRFYGAVLEDKPFDPGALDNVEIQLGYKCFGLLIKVGNLPGGTVTVKDITTDVEGHSKDDKEKLLLSGVSLTAEGQEWEGLFSMNDLKAEEETFSLLFTWDKGNGVTETFSSGPVVVHPKKRKILTLNVTGTIDTPTKGNITLTKDSEDLTDEDEQTTVSNQSVSNQTE